MKPCTDIAEHDWLVTVTISGAIAPLMFTARGTVAAVTRHFLSHLQPGREQWISMRAIDTDPL